MSSPRRGGNEQSILEMLERDTGRAGGLQPRSHVGWYIAGGALAVSLVGLLAWVAHESPKVQQAEAVLAAISTERAASAPAATDNNLADAAPALAHAPGPLPQHAAIVDEQQQSSRTRDAQDQLQLPPLVLAKPGVLGAVPPAQPTGGAVLHDEQPAAAQQAAQAPLQQAAAKQATAELAGSPSSAAPQQALVTSGASPQQAVVTTGAATQQGPATSGAAPQQALVTSNAAPQQALVTSSAAPQQAPVASSAAPEQATAKPSAAPEEAKAASGAVSGTTAQPPARQAAADTARNRAAGKNAAGKRATARKVAKNSARSKKPAVTGRTAETHVDSDVALISAVIQHTANRPEPPCADAKCAAKATPEP